ncbi:YolD-like family protein [Paenibacillus enshidis]|uniref:YolD-like family protein n=1 Tax=Paenibacillus enshidis TaxID=1458439 RepID=A0ABV5AYQ1_9BACL
MNDRGHKKWTALMLPEHKERIQRWVQSQNDISMPILEEDQLQEINELVMFSMAEQRIIEVVYFQNKRLMSATGIIKHCDPLTGILVLNQDEYTEKIAFSSIKQVRL